MPFLVKVDSFAVILHSVHAAVSAIGIDPESE